MNDFEDDVRERSRIARGARHKRNGSRTKYVSLPSDNLTAAQKRKLNGRVYTMDLTEPMKWEKFTGMPETMQKLYIEALQEKYAASDEQLGRMFGRSGVTVLNKRRQLGIPKNETRPTEIQKFEWREFLVTPACEEAKLEDSEPEAPCVLFSGKIRVSAVLDFRSWDDLANVTELMKKFPNGTTFKVEYGNEE